MSWISFPPQKRDIVYENEFLMTKVSFLADKIKSKFQYGNMLMHAVAPPPKVPKAKKPSRRT